MNLPPRLPGFYPVTREEQEAALSRPPAGEPAPDLLRQWITSSAPGLPEDQVQELIREIQAMLLRKCKRGLATGIPQPGSAT